MDNVPRLRLSDPPFAAGKPSLGRRIDRAIARLAGLFSTDAVRRRRVYRTNGDLVWGSPYGD